MVNRGKMFPLEGHHPIKNAGVFVADKLFISTKLGGALKITNCITCLYKTVLDVNYLFQKNSSPPPPPPPCELNGGPLTENYIFLYHISAIVSDICTFEVSIPMFWWSNNIIKPVIGGYLRQNCPKRVNWDKMTRHYRKLYFVTYLGRYYRYLHIRSVYTQGLMVKYHF